MAYRGDWTPGVAYAVGDAVLYSGNIYTTWAGTLVGAGPPAQDSNSWVLAFGKREDTDITNWLNSLFPGYLPGKTYVMYDSTTSSTAIQAIDTIYFYPFRVYAPLRVTAGAVRVDTGGAGSSVKGAVWANSPLSHRPVGIPLLVDNTGVATTGSGLAALAMTGLLMPGVYWFGIKSTGTLPTMRSTQAVIGLAPNTASTPAFISLSFADTYSNSMPTLAEGASFTATSFAATILQLTT